MIQLVNLIAQLAIFTFAGYLAKSGEITMGALLIIVTFFSMLTFYIRRSSESFLDAQNRVTYIQGIHDFLQTPTEEAWKGKEELVVSKGAISFRDLRFAYQKSETVLENFNLEIPSGERFALVGESGSGKTTLAYMLVGFYRPQQGEIWIDGQRLAACSLKSIRRSVGLIAQDVLIFDGTILENIRLGRRDATEEEVLSACSQAGLMELVQELPQGLHTRLGLFGVGLSGGQRQRIAIARIYLKNPKVIIFDEATSALDSETEEAIHEAWRKVLAGRTSLVIAHRVRSVLMCERAAILQNGRICEVGVPERMAKESAVFRRLFALREGE